MNKFALALSFATIASVANAQGTAGAPGTTTGTSFVGGTVTTTAIIGGVLGLAVLASVLSSDSPSSSTTTTN